jgi:hypothetical protein
MIYAPGGIWGIGERIRDRLLGDEEEGTA